MQSGHDGRLVISLMVSVSFGSLGNSQEGDSKFSCVNEPGLSMFDPNRDGVLTLSELRAVAEQFDNQQLRDLVVQAESQGLGGIQYDGNCEGNSGTATATGTVPDIGQGGTVSGIGAPCQIVIADQVPRQYDNDRECAAALAAVLPAGAILQGDSNGNFSLVNANGVTEQQGQCPGNIILSNGTIFQFTCGTSSTVPIAPTEASAATNQNYACVNQPGLSLFDPNKDGILTLDELRAVAEQFDNQQLRDLVAQTESQGLAGIQYDGNCQGNS